MSRNEPELQNTKYYFLIGCHSKTDTLYDFFWTVSTYIMLFQQREEGEGRYKRLQGGQEIVIRMLTRFFPIEILTVAIFIVIDMVFD